MNLITMVCFVANLSSILTTTGETIIYHYSTLTDMSYESKKILIFSATYERLLYNSMNLAGYKINSIEVNFYLQNVWKFLEKKSVVRI